MKTKYPKISLIFPFFIGHKSLLAVALIVLKDSPWCCMKNTLYKLAVIQYNLYCYFCLSCLWLVAFIIIRVSIRAD